MKEKSLNRAQRVIRDLLMAIKEENEERKWRLQRRISRYKKLSRVFWDELTWMTVLGSAECKKNAEEIMKGCPFMFMSI